MTKYPRHIVTIGCLLLWILTPEAANGQTAAGRTAKVNDIEMSYEVQGAGEPLLLLHGFGGCGQDWQPFVALLARHFKLIIPDLRGHGGSTNRAGRFTHRQAAADVFALLDQLGVPQVRAMGISTGGMTLLHMATSQASRVEAMVLIGATHYFPEQARAIMRRTSQRGTPSEDARRSTDCATRGDAQVRELMKQFGEFKDSYDDMNFTVPYLGTIKARTLIVHGDRDEFFPISIPVEMYRAIPGSALWIIPNGDHVPIFGSHAREFQEVVLPFLRRDRPAR